VHLPNSHETRCSRRTECANCSKMFACNSYPWAGLTCAAADMVDTASRLNLTNAVSRSRNCIAFQSLTSTYSLTVCGACKTGNLVPLFATRTPQKYKSSSGGKMATTQPRGTDCVELALRAPTWNLMKLPRFAPPRTRLAHQYSNK